MLLEEQECENARRILHMATSIGLALSGKDDGAARNLARRLEQLAR